jgi:hypothetical protein
MRWLWRTIMTTPTAEKFREGDIFTWRYKEDVEKSRHNCGVNTAYWCKSQIAVVRNGHLVDTYWGLSNDGSYLNRDEIVLTFLGNPADMEKIYPGERVFYRDEDIVDMSHPNNSGAPIYAKASRNADVMKAYYTYQIERTENEIEWATRRIKECRNAISQLEAGKTDGSFPVYR